MRCNAVSDLNLNRDLKPSTPAPLATVQPATRLNPVLLIFLIFPIAGLIIAVLVGSQKPPAYVPIPPAIAYNPVSLVNQPAPNFSLLSLNDRQVALSSFHGQIVFLNFWATYCAPCKVEMPALQQLMDGKIPLPANAIKATVLTVNQGDSADSIRTFFASLSVNLPTVLDPNISVGDQYRLVNLPHTFVIDAEGVIRYDHIGIVNADDLAKYIKVLSDSAYF